MRPRAPMNDGMNMRLAHPEALRNGLLRAPSIVKRADAPHLRLGKSSSSTIFSAQATAPTKTELLGAAPVLRVSYILQVARAVVRLVSVTMVNFTPFGTRPEKCLRDELVNRPCPAGASIAQIDSWIRLASALSLQRHRQNTPRVAPSLAGDAANATVIADFIKLLVSNYISPSLHHVAPNVAIPFS